MRRRDFLGAVLLAPTFTQLAACGKSPLPEGMVEIKWDRDTCIRCRMVISDRRFAAQLRGGPKDESFKFDDIGCVAFWLRDQAWGRDAATRIWVADSTGGAEVRWLDARKAHYAGGKISPMGYNQAALGMPQPGSFDFNEMSQHVLARGK